jgi:hypothetical protein
MTEVRKAISGIPPKDAVVIGEITVVGNQKFKINSPNFIVSPLKKDASLYINSIHSGVEDPRCISVLVADDYNKITGAVPNTVFYVDTDETFYVKW